MDFSYLFVYFQARCWHNGFERSACWVKITADDILKYINLFFLVNSL